jgi:hypothetical protein
MIMAMMVEMNLTWILAGVAAIALIVWLVVRWSKP